MIIRWTDEMDAVLRELASKGCSAREIAEEVKKIFPLAQTATKNSIIGRAGRQRIPLCRPNHSPIKKQKINTEPIKKEKPVKAVKKRGEKQMDKPVLQKIVVPEKIEISGKRIIDLGAYDCRWTDSNGHPGDFIFCAKPKKDGSSYCAEHHARNFMPAKKR